MYSTRTQPYAPNPYATLPNATISLHNEVTLSSTSAERELYDNLAEIYSVIVTLDALEKAYIKDSVSASAYTDSCSRLLQQYKVLTADPSVHNEFQSLDAFRSRWAIEAPRAVERIRIGLPATVSEANLGSTSGSGPITRQTSEGTSKGPAATAILEATQDFITFLDALKLGLLAKDSLHPLLADVIQSANKVTDKDFEGRGKIVQWLITLNGMRATEELDEERARQLSFDMETAYHGFKDALR